MRNLEVGMRNQWGEYDIAKASGDKQGQIKAKQKIDYYTEIHQQIADKTGLPVLKERMVARKTTVKSKGVDKNVLKTGNNGGIIREQSKKPITKITDSAISRVPKVDIPTYNDEQNAFIQKQHKQLLQYAVDENEHKEVAFAFNDRLEKIGGGFQGTDDKLDFGNALIGKGKDLIVMHNHPRNSSYSDTDLVFLLEHDDIKTFTIVKNNGSVETITKSLNYNQAEAKKIFSRCYKKHVKTGSDTEIDKAINQFLNQNKEMILWKRSQ